MRAPIFYRAARAAWRLLVVLAVGLAGFVALELLRLYALFARLHKVAGWVYLGLLALALLWALVRAFAFLRSGRELQPPPAPPDGAHGHKEMRTYCRFLIRRLKRLSDSPLLPPEQQQALRQQAYDIEDVLGAHPLNDDLHRAIDRAVADVLGSAQGELRARAETEARASMARVALNIIEPPFPSIGFFTVVGNQLVVASRVVDAYLPQASLVEYAIVLSSVLRVLTVSQFTRLGQALFAGVYSNSPPLGPAADDLAQALTSAWLTRATARSAMLRCESLRPWSTEVGAAELEQDVHDLLGDTKDCILRDIMPALKLRIRQHAPPGTVDAGAFTTTISEGLSRAIDSLMKAYRAQAPAETLAAARRTLHGSVGVSTLPPPPREDRHGRRRHGGRRAKGIFRLFKTFGQRVKYSRGPHSGGGF